MAFIGRLDLTVPDLLQILSLGKKTGKLRLSRLGNSGEVLFKDGKVIYAASDSTRNTLGNILVSQKHITEDSLMAALEMQHLSPKSKRLGAILVEKGIITPVVLQEAIRYQIEQVISEFLTWESGFFRFETAEVAIDDGITVDANEVLAKAGITPEHFLLEGTIRLDEQPEIEHLPQATPVVPPSPVQDLSPASQIDEQREAERPPQVTPDATPASPTDRQATAHLDARREAKQPPRAAPKVTPSHTPDPSAAIPVKEEPKAVQPPRVAPATTPPPTPDRPAMSRLDAQREAKRPPSVAPDATAAPPSDRQATVRPDARREAVRPPRAAAPTSPPPAPDRPAASRVDESRQPDRTPKVAPDAPGSPPDDRQATTRLDARREAVRPAQATPEATPSQTPDPSAPSHLDEQHKAVRPSRTAAPTTPPPAPDPSVVSRVDARPEAEQPARATPAVTPPPPTSDLSAAETSEPLVRAKHGEEAVPASPPSSHATPVAQAQEIDFPSITDEIMLSSPISPWVLIMHFAADVVGRGVLLSVETDGITGHDQFGVSDGAESGDEAVRHIKIPLREASAFAMIVSRPTTYRGKIDPGKWNDYFLETLGGKRPHEVVLIPIVLAGKVVAIFYGDDAGTDKPLGDVMPLEAFIGQTFSAIETSLLEKRSKTPA